MDAEKVITLLAPLLTTTGGVWFGMKYAINGMREDVRGIARDIREVRDLAREHKSQLAEHRKTEHAV